MKFSLARYLLQMAAAVVVLVGLTGCIGIYNNTELFLNQPQAGAAQADVLRTYGAPTFASQSDVSNAFVYKVRKVYYIILIGLYDGHDMVVTFNNEGKVEDVKNVPRPRAFCLMNPVPWAVPD